MKTIQPVKVWFNGQEQDCNILIAQCISDNLVDSASFNYQLAKQSDPNPINNGIITLVSGSLNMTGQDYDNWQTNDYAYNWVANQLNLVISN